MLSRLSLLLSLALQPAELLWGQAAPGDLKATFLGQHPFQQQRLTESSALVASATQKDILWTLNDSGNPAELFATDRLGRNRGLVRVDERIQTLPIPSNQGGSFLVTDASLGEDGRVAVRTYRYVYFFTLDGTRFTPVATGFRCDASGLELQGEGIAWLNGDTLATSSERALAGGGISRITCGR